jgi:transposase
MSFSMAKYHKCEKCGAPGPWVFEPSVILITIVEKQNHIITSYQVNYLCFFCNVSHPRLKKIVTRIKNIAKQN